MSTIDLSGALYTQVEELRALSSSIRFALREIEEIVRIAEHESTIQKHESRIRELEDGLRLIRDGHFSSEGARDIAEKTLLGAPDYKIPEPPPND